MEIEPTSYTIGEIIPLKHEMPTEKDIQDIASWLKQKGCILTKFEVLNIGGYEKAKQT